MTKFAITAAVAAAIAGSASAQTVSMQFLGTGEGRNVKITLDGDSKNVFAGELRHKITSTDMSTDFIGEFVTFCVDLSQNVSSNSSVFNAVPLQQAPQVANKSLEAARRMAAAADAHQLGNQDIATGVQLALWELIYDFDASEGISSLDLTSGRFSATRTNGNPLWNSVSSFANSILHIAFADLPMDTYNNYTVLTSSNRQDQLVPVPSAGPLALAGAGGLLVLVRRRRNA
jgi:hypothetical protein